MNRLDMRAKITALLSGGLGEYTYADGAKFPAIWMGGKVDPLIITTTGLEVLIMPTPEIMQQRMSGYEVRVEKQWEVVLVQHDSNSSLEDALLILIANLDMYRDPVRLNETDNVFEQATVYPRTVEVLAAQLEE